MAREERERETELEAMGENKEPKPEKSIAERLATINGHEIRREILQAAREAHAAGRLVSPVGLHKQLKKPIASVSYHVVVLRDEGALELLDTAQRRGAQEHLYGINEGLLAEIGDSVALDQIAELLDDKPPARIPLEEKIVGIIRATGRPVED
jgi:DNA-binding transcriptional ArsR family regulator